MKRQIKAAVLGCTGYTGIELIKILIKHPDVIISFLGSQNHQGEYINDFDQSLKRVTLPKLESLKSLNFEELDVVFFALPQNISQNIIKQNFDKSIFIDLSPDFRLDNSLIYEKNYKLKHQCPEIINEFIYGLPEIYFENIKKTKNIAVPGCYPTSILLPLIPIFKENLIITNNIIIDSKSGYSGAGKKFNKDNLIQKKGLNFYNYNTNNHRHICEIHQELKKFSDNEVLFSFNPHILPNFRGLMSTIYCELNNKITKDEILQVYKEAYSNNSLIEIVEDNKTVDFYSVINTNKCIIKLYDHFSKNRIIIVSIIDNLLKGASGQAVQCMNIIFGLDETIGLI